MSPSHYMAQNVIWILFIGPLLIVSWKIGDWQTRKQTCFFIRLILISGNSVICKESICAKPGMLLLKWTLVDSSIIRYLFYCLFPAGCLFLLDCFQDKLSSFLPTNCLYKWYSAFWAWFAYNNLLSLVPANSSSFEAGKGSMCDTRASSTSIKHACSTGYGFSKEIIITTGQQLF